MLEQWHADELLRMPKVYSRSPGVDLEQGADDDYPIESDDGTEQFILDIMRSRRNARKARFQLRYQRGVVLARLCTHVPHTNPDHVRIDFPHLHRYQEDYGDKWAKQLQEFDDLAAALNYFCGVINLPMPEIQGGLE